MSETPLRFFYDTEFIERGPDHPVSLISIGVVGENGDSLYLVNREAPWEAVYGNDWLVANVVPHLPPASAWVTRAEIRDRLTAFMAPSGGEKPELWAYYADYDHVVLAQLWGRMIDLPDWMPMYTRDLKQEIDRLGVDKAALPSQEGGEHDALADACWVRAAFHALDQRSPSPAVPVPDVTEEKR